MTTRPTLRLIRLVLPKTVKASIFILIFKEIMKLHQCLKCFEYIYIYILYVLRFGAVDILQYH